MSDPIRVVMAGGGTAGHTSPLIATAEQLRLQAEVDILCIGTAKGLESRVIPEAGLELALIPPVPLPRSLSSDLAALPFRLRTAVKQSRALLRKQQAQVVIGFGSYVSLPVYLAAKAEKVPLVVHEGNAVPGLANKVAARFAQQVITAFPDTPLPGARMLGLPVRAAIADLDRAGLVSEARKSFNLPPTGKVLLVSGGSQGARSLNQATVDAMGWLLEAGVSVLHVLGAANLTDEIVATNNPYTGAVYRPVGYVNEMSFAYAAADLMLGRSGAGTVMETAMVGLPTIFVPLPHGNGEQARNADFLVDAGAGLLVRDAELTAERLLAEVVAVLGEPGRLDLMSQTCRDLAPANAAQELAELVLGLVDGAN
jgi:UDP-N-acetylglucosamine--N-acetylmuramyl-(pentapeptide) pyrophosphoryl-undecaprenol N-acetylglucosamine transferase